MDDIIAVVKAIIQRQVKGDSHAWDTHHIGIFATKIAVLASRIYQNSHIGENG